MLSGILTACGGGGGGGGSPPPTNQAPTANAGADQNATEQTQVTLTGSGSDSDGSVSSYLWTQTAGTSVTLTNPSSASSTFTAPATGINETLTFQISVTDDDGASSTDAVDITILTLNLQPVANAGANQATAAGGDVTLSGTAVDTDGTVVGYSWSQISGQTVTLQNANSAIASFTAPASGSADILRFQLTATDNLGGIGSDQTDITVAANNAPQVQAVAPQTIEENSPLVVPVSATDVEGTPSLSADLTLVPGASFTDNGDGTGQLNWTPPAGTAPGSPYGVTITATDDLDSAITSDAVVTINVQASGSSTLPISDNFSDGNANGWSEGGLAGIWGVSSGAYVQSDDNVEDYDDGYFLGARSILTATSGLSAYRFSVDATPLSRFGRDIGVLFRYQDASNYYRLSRSSQNGFTRLEKRVGGSFSTLAANGLGYGAQGDAALDNALETQQITIEVVGSLIQVFINGVALFSVEDSDLATGGIGLYTQDEARFDNVLIETNDDQPSIVIASPLERSVLPNGPATIDVTAVARNVPSPNGSVVFSVDDAGGSCTAASESSTGVFTASCPAVATGNHTFVAQLFDQAMVMVDEDRNEFVGIGSAGSNGHRYDAVGDSITEGTKDLYSRNNLAPGDSRAVSFQGWPGLLGGLLNTATGAPNQVINEGVSGDTTGEAFNLRILSDIERNPDSNRALLLLGTNDTRITGPLPSGAGCVGAACDNTFKGNMLGIINALLAAGRERVYVGLIPPTFGNTVNSAPHVDPINAGRNATTRSFNNVIINELVPMTGVELGPDFYSCFLSAAENRFSLFAENIHPNALGYEMMAHLWRDVLTGTPVIPDSACPAPIYIVDDLVPTTYKQNYLQVGNEYYIDETYTLTAIPTELEDGVWISTANGNSGSSASPLVSFDAGASPVTVYVAYDPTGPLPVSSTHALSALGSLPSGQTLQTSGGGVGTFAIARAQNVSGTFSVNGLNAGGRDNYLVIVTGF